MKTYTIEDIANFEKDECGRLICPSGDYSQIESFGEGRNRNGGVMRYYISGAITGNPNYISDFERAE